MIQRQKHNKNVGQKEVPSPTELRRQTWQSIEGVVALLLKIMFEILLDRAATEQIGAAPYERTGSRKNYRNGAYKGNVKSFV